MSLQIHLLACLAEEATEVSQEAIHCIQHGPSAVPHPGSEDYKTLLALEYADLIAINDLMEESGFGLPIWGEEFKAAYKFRKVTLEEMLNDKGQTEALLQLVVDLNIFAQSVSKCIRFSMEHVSTLYFVSNAVRSAMLLAEVAAAIDYISDRWFPIPINGEVIEERAEGKMRKTMRLVQEVSMPLGLVRTVA